VSGLGRKLGRDLVTLRWQILSIAVVVASGVAILVASLGTFRSLTRARDAFYARTRFADLFVRLERAPDVVAGALARIDGVAAVETRLVFDVPLDLPGVAEPVSARAISLPRPGQAARSRLVVVRGRLPRAGARREVAVNEAFAAERALCPGDVVPAVLHGRREELTVVGEVLSAEHVAALRPGEVIPDNARFGILWLSYDALAAAYRAEGTFDEAALWLAPGAHGRAVIAAVDRVLAPHGGSGAIGRAEQPAHRFVDTELSELNVIATVLPVIFLGVAGFLLNMVLARIVAQERTQIATLRALGFRVAAVVRHYLALATIVAGSGALAGVALGIVLGRSMTRMYAPFFRFPDLSYRVDAAVLALGVATSLAAGLLGAFASARRLARLAPAEALQAAAPPVFRTGPFSRAGLAQRLPTTLRLALRDAASRPVRAATSTVGVAAAMGILVVGAFWSDAFAVLLEQQFGRVQREDATVTFVESRRDRAVRELAHVPGVRAVEGLRVVPARLLAGARAKRVELLGLSPPSMLRRLIAADGSTTALPPDGVVLSGHLAEHLGVSRGAPLSVEVLEGERPRRVVTVAAVVDERVGMSAYMHQGALARLLGEAPSASAALLTLEPGREREVHAALRRFPGVATITIKDAVVRRFTDTMMEIVIAFSTVLTVLGALVVAGIVYNSARILTSERERELATMRVIGFTRGDISEVLLLQLALQVLPALGVGAALGYALAAMAVRLFGPEDLSIPLVVGVRTWALALAVVLVSAALTALTVRRRLDRLDLVSTLKVRE
jgi:putative ABC transport system permease protein